MVNGLIHRLQPTGYGISGSKLTSLVMDSSRAGTSTGAHSHPSGAAGCGGASADVALPLDEVVVASFGAAACGRSSAVSGPTALASAD